MGYAVWSPSINCTIIFSDAESKNQARAAYKRYLRRMNLSSFEMKQFMTGIKVTEVVDDNSGYHTMIKVE